MKRSRTNKPMGIMRRVDIRNEWCTREKTASSVKPYFRGNVIEFIACKWLDNAKLDAVKPVRGFEVVFCLVGFIRPYSTMFKFYKLKKKTTKKLRFLQSFL